MSTNIKPDQPRLSVPVLLYIASALALCALFVFALARFHEDLSHPRIEHLDRAILEGIHAQDTPWLTALARILSFIGSPMTLFPAIPIAAAILWRHGPHRDAALLLLGMAGGGLLESTIKLHYRRIRPDVPWAFVHERSFSFPSGHSVLAAVLYGLLAYLTLKRCHTALQRAAVLLACVSLILAIGASRIYLGAHFPSDVLAGYFVGATWLLFLFIGDRTLGPTTPRSAARPDTPESDMAAETPPGSPAR